MQQKLGILVPRSEMYPTLGKDFLSGIKLGLDTRQDDIQCIIEGIGSASDDNLIRTAEKMVLQEEVDLTVSFCSAHLLEELVKSTTAYSHPLVHASLGSNVLKQVHQSEQVIHHSLNFWQAAYQAGAHAVAQYGPRIAVAASYYDGGYMHTQAFIAGLTDHGGDIASFHVAPMDYKSNDFQTMIEEIQSSEADAAFLIFSFKEGDKVLQALADSPLNGSVPFMAIPTLTDESFNHRNHGLKSMTSIASWSFDDPNPMMQNFVESFTQKQNSPPNIFGLLGFEIGHTVKHMLDTHGHIPKKLQTELQTIALESPRGMLHYNSNGESQVETLKIRNFNFNQVRYHNTVIDSLPTLSAEDLYPKFEAVAYSGWQNPYICT